MTSPRSSARLGKALSRLVPNGRPAATPRTIPVDALRTRVTTETARMHASAGALYDPQVAPRLQDFKAALLHLLDLSAQHPDLVPDMDKYFGVYLDSAVEASHRFATIYVRTGDELTRAKYIALLDQLIATYTARAKPDPDCDHHSALQNALNRMRR